MERVRKYALPLALLADVVLVVVFAAIGRRTHEETNAVLGVLDTAWPFLVGLAIGWLISIAVPRSSQSSAFSTPTNANASARARANINSNVQSPLRPFPSGVIIWLATIAVGMGLRMATDAGTAVAFVIVASTFNLATLVGWRVLARLVVRRRA